MEHFRPSEGVFLHYSGFFSQQITGQCCHKLTHEAVMHANHDVLVFEQLV